MVKICLACHEVNAGGYRCHRCGGRLVHTDDPEARSLPETVWRSQRVDYGARRGMIARFLGIFAGAGVALYGVRSAVPLPSPWNAIGAVAAVLLGIVVWRLIHRAADRGVKLWVLDQSRVHKRRLARALWTTVRRPALADARTKFIPAQRRTGHQVVSGRR
jgi:hypothetical protein